MFLHGSYFLQVFNIQMPTGGQTSLWILFFVCSYIIGVFLNRLQALYWAEDKDAFYREVQTEISLPPNVKQNREDSYYRAYSFVRLYNAAAIAEVDRQIAEYKLFGSLTLVFMLDLPLAWIREIQSWPRALLMCVLAPLALWRFLFLLDWARRITFDYYTLMTKGPRPLASD